MARTSEADARNLSGFTVPRGVFGLLAAEVEADGTRGVASIEQVPPDRSRCDEFEEM
jgi:hypothetical protein